MKKLFAFVLAFALLLGLFSCGKADVPVPSKTQPVAETEAATPRPEDKPSRMTSYNRDGTLQSTMIYEYDEKGNFIRSEQRLNGSIYVCTYKNSYNEEGQLVQAEIQAEIQGRVSDYIDFITYEYNADGQLIRSHVTDTEFGEFGGVTTYTYNEQGQLVQADSGGMNPVRSTYEYDEQGLRIRENVYYNYRDTLDGYSIYEYE